MSENVPDLQRKGGFHNSGSQSFVISVLNWVGDDRLQAYVSKYSEIPITRTYINHISG